MYDKWDFCILNVFLMRSFTISIIFLEILLRVLDLMSYLECILLDFIRFIGTLFNFKCENTLWHEFWVLWKERAMYCADSKITYISPIYLNVLYKWNLIFYIITGLAHFSKWNDMNIIVILLKNRFYHTKKSMPYKLEFKLT